MNTASTPSATDLPAGSAAEPSRSGSVHTTDNSTPSRTFDRFTRSPDSAPSASPTRPLGQRTTKSVRVVLHQSSLAKFRVPVFAELARRASIELTVSYGQVPGLSNVEPQGFESRFGRVRSISRRPSLYWQTQQFRSSLLTGAKKPDVLVLPWDLHYLSLVPAILVARARGMGVVLWGHGYSKQDNAARTWARMRVGRLAHCVVLYNARTRDFLLKNGIPAERTFVAPNSIDQEPVQRARWEWVSTPGKLTHFRRDHALESGPVLLFVSRLLRERRVDLMLRAMQLLAAKHPKMQAVIIGGGPEEAAIRQMVRELDITELDRDGRPINPDAADSKNSLSIRLLGAIYDERDLAPWFLCSDAMCFPSFMGLSVLHAFGYGLPVVTSDEPSQHGPEFAAIREGENGKTFRADDAEDLARQLDWLLSDPERLRMASNAALSTALNDYNVPSMVDGLESAIRFANARASGGA